MHYSSPYPGDLLVHLGSFLAVVRHAARPGAFEAAARELAVDRSVLRRRLQTLSDWAGTPLLEGRGPRMQLTRAGESLSDRARSLLHAAASLRDGIGEQPVEIVVGCTGTITTELLPDVLAAARRGTRPPRITVKRAGGSLCLRLLERGELDVGIVRMDDERRPPRGTRLFEDRLWLLVPNRHPLAAARRITLDDLEGAALVLYGEASRTRRRILDRLSSRDVSIAVEVDGKAAAIEYVRRGLGLSFVSAVPWVTPRAPGITARDVTPLFRRAAFHLLLSPARRTSSHVAAFTDLVRDEVANRRHAR